MTTNLYALTEARENHPTFGQPFYIGIGTSERPYRHLAQSRSKQGHRNLRLHEILVSHRALGFVPGVQILGVFETKTEAGEAEKEAIKRYGRVAIEKDGTLCNLASGGQGPDADLMRLPEVRQRNSEAQKRRPRESFDAFIATGQRNARDPEINRMRAEISTAMNKRTWADPAVKKRRTEAMKGKKKTLTPEAIAARQANAAKGHTPEAKAARSQTMLDLWQQPEHQAAHAAGQTAAWTDPEKRANMLAGRSEGIAKSWEDPEVRARRIAGIRAAMGAPAEPLPKQSAEVTAAHRSANMTALNATFTADERSAAQADAWTDAGVRERRIAGIKAAAQDPALKAARLAAMLAGKRRKAAEKAAAAVERE